MKTATVFLPGRFEDAQIYMGRLVLLTAERTVRFFRIADIVERLEARLGRLAPIPKMLFSHNDWLRTEQFRSLLSNRAIRQTFHSVVDMFPQPHFEIDLSTLQNSEEEIPIQASVVLDFMIYARRMYFGCDSGFYHLDPDWYEEFPVISGGAQKRLDARCISLSARFGAVNASCGKEGLFSATDEFGYLDRPRRNQWDRKADASVRTSWLDFDIVNYSKRDSPTLLQNAHEFMRRAQLRVEPNILTEIGMETLDLGRLLNEALREHQVSAASIQYAYNSNRVLFVHTYEGQFFSIGLKATGPGRLALKFTNTYKGAGTRILDAQPLLNGVVLETDSRVFAFLNGTRKTLAETEVLTVRTFPHSRNFKNLVAVTTEAGVFLISVYDEEDFGITVNNPVSAGERRLHARQ